MPYDPSIVDDPRFQSLSPDRQAAILKDLAPPPRTMLQRTSDYLGDLRARVTDSMAEDLATGGPFAPQFIRDARKKTDLNPERTLAQGRSVASFLNPVPGSLTDVGQLLGSMTSLVPAVKAASPLLRIGLGMLSSGGGRTAGALVEGRDPLTEGAIGLASGAVPGVVSAAKTGVQIAGSRISSQKTVREAVDYLSSLLPKGAPPLASKDMATLQDQLAAGGPNTLAKFAKDSYNTVSESIRDRLGFGTEANELTTLLSKIENIGARIERGQVPVKGGQKVLSAQQEQLVGEFVGRLHKAGRDDLAAEYLAARHEFARVHDVLRLLTGGGENKRPLELGEGKIDLSRLQKQFLETRQKGGLRSFSPEEAQALNLMLGRGEALTKTDRALRLPFFSGTSHGSFRIGGQPQLVDLPRAAGVQFQGPTALQQMMLPMMISSQFSQLRR